MDNRRQKRIEYLEQQIAAGDRLDGYTLEGHKKELEALKIIKESSNNTKKCGCGQTQDADGNCDGSHNKH
jgi:CDGSH-type Zn-finger protein